MSLGYVKDKFLRIFFITRSILIISSNILLGLPLSLYPSWWWAKVVAVVAQCSPFSGEPKPSSMQQWEHWREKADCGSKEKVLFGDYWGQHWSTSKALHWRGWWEVWWGWDLRQALLKELPLRLSKVAATCRGVTCAWPLLRSNPRDCFNTKATSAVRVCCNA